MLKELCRGCNKPIPIGTGGYCKGCKTKRDKARKARDKDRYKRYDKQRDGKQHRFYKTKAWRAVRGRIRSRDNGLCLVCKSRKRIRNGRTVHHIIPLEDDWNKRLDEDNLICLCDSCHKLIHKLYEESKEKKKEVQERLREMLREN